MITDKNLYKFLLCAHQRIFTFDDEELYNKSNKFLLWLGYKLNAIKKETKFHPNYRIDLLDYIVRPGRDAQIDKLIEEYMKGLQ